MAYRRRILDSSIPSSRSPFIQGIATRPTEFAGILIAQFDGTNGTRLNGEQKYAERKSCPDDDPAKPEVLPGGLFAGRGNNGLRRIMANCQSTGLFDGSPDKAIASGGRVPWPECHHQPKTMTKSCRECRSLPSFHRCWTEHAQSNPPRTNSISQVFRKLFID